MTRHIVAALVLMIAALPARAGDKFVSKELGFEIAPPAWSEPDPASVTYAVFTLPPQNRFADNVSVNVFTRSTESVADMSAEIFKGIPTSAKVLAKNVGTDSFSYEDVEPGKNGDTHAYVRMVRGKGRWFTLVVTAAESNWSVHAKALMDAVDSFQAKAEAGPGFSSKKFDFHMADLSVGDTRPPLFIHASFFLPPENRFADNIQAGIVRSTQTVSQIAASIEQLETPTHHTLLWKHLGPGEFIIKDSWKQNGRKLYGYARYVKTKDGFILAESISAASNWKRHAKAMIASVDSLRALPDSTMAGAPTP